MQTSTGRELARMVPAMAQKLTQQAFPCFRESGNHDKIPGASASIGDGLRSRFEKVSDGVTRDGSLPDEHGVASAQSHKRLKLLSASTTFYGL